MIPPPPTLRSEGLRRGERSELSRPPGELTALASETSELKEPLP